MFSFVLFDMYMDLFYGLVNAIGGGLMSNELLLILRPLSHQNRSVPKKRADTKNALL